MVCRSGGGGRGGGAAGPCGCSVTWTHLPDYLSSGPAELSTFSWHERCWGDVLAIIIHHRQTGLLQSILVWRPCIRLFCGWNHILIYYVVTVCWESRLPLKYGRPRKWRYWHRSTWSSLLSMQRGTSFLSSEFIFIKRVEICQTENTSLSVIHLLISFSPAPCYFWKHTDLSGLYRTQLQTFPGSK